MSTISVYKLTCTVNGKGYIGVTSQSLERRLSQHRYKVRQGSHLPLYCAMRKYGVDSFNVSVLEESTNKEYAFNVLEPRLIVEHQTSVDHNGYNLAPGGEGLKASYKRRPHSEETKRKMHKSHIGRPKSEEHKASLSAAKRRPEAIERLRELMTGNQLSVGYHHTEEAKQKIRKANLGKVLLEETRLKMREAKKGKGWSEQRRQSYEARWGGQ